MATTQRSGELTEIKIGKMIHSYSRSPIATPETRGRTLGPSYADPFYLIRGKYIYEDLWSGSDNDFQYHRQTLIIGLIDVPYIKRPTDLGQWVNALLPSRKRRFGASISCYHSWEYKIKCYVIKRRFVVSHHAILRRVNERYTDMSGIIAN